jgi:prepilin-type N-terminal cleavage/methylation domain-containing protein
MRRADLRAGRVGFTLVELMVAVVLMGLLAAFSTQRVGDIREHGLIVTMRSDLRHFAVAEESYAYDVGTYTSDVADLRMRGLQTSPGIQISVQEATRTGWSATARHTGTERACYVIVGDAAPVGAALEDGVVECD